MKNTQQKPSEVEPEPVKPIFCCQRVPEVGTTFITASSIAEATMATFTYEVRGFGPEVPVVQAAMLGDPQTILKGTPYLLEVQSLGNETRWFTQGYTKPSLDTKTWIEFYFEGNPPPHFVKDYDVCESFACEKCQIKYKVDLLTWPEAWVHVEKLEREKVSRPQVGCIAMAVHQTRKDGI